VSPLSSSQIVETNNGHHSKKPLRKKYKIIIAREKKKIKRIEGLVENSADSKKF